MAVPNYKPILHAHAEELVGSLLTLLRIPSVAGTPTPTAPNGTEVSRCLHETLALCERLGLSTANMDEQVGWCEYGDGAEMIAVLGHLDVVPAGDGWQEAEPFAGVEKNGRIYGRGAIDDKGPMVAAIYALAALKEAGFAPSRRIRLLFGTSEETGSQDMAWYLAHGGEVPIMGFTPDGAYPLIQGEKGIFNGTVTRSLPSTGAYCLRTFAGGSAANVCPDYAVAELDCPAEAAAHIDKDNVTVTPLAHGIRVEATGVSAHGSTPEQGENAIGRLALALAELPLEGELNDCIAFLAERIGMETRGESLGLAMRDTESGELTFNLGTAALQDGVMTLTFSVRYPVTADPDRVRQRLTRAFSLGNYTFAALEHAPALYLPAKHPLIQTLSRVYEEQTGQPATLQVIGGGTYAKSMPNLVAFGPTFPGDEVREHQADEFIERARLLQNAEIIAAAICELAK